MSIRMLADTDAATETVCLCLYVASAFSSKLEQCERELRGLEAAKRALEGGLYVGHRLDTVIQAVAGECVSLGDYVCSLWSSGREQVC